MERGERFNTLSHLFGSLLATGGGVVLIVLAALKGDAWEIVSFSIYAATLMLLYSSSTLYHNARKGSRLKRILRSLDHNSIYLLIAGTYTPFMLVSLRGGWGWSLFGVVWGLAVVGILQELWLPRKTRIISMVIYVLMGWIAVIAVVPLVKALTWQGFAWVVAGGLAYTIGIAFYVNDRRLRHSHGIWHLFVLAGSILHYFAILLYVA